MALQNSWVTYLERGYKSIKASIINRLKVIVPEVTDLSSSNIFIIIIDLFAGLVEQLNYYIDNLARELYISTARRFSSLVKLTRLIDYVVKAKVGSTVDLKIMAVDSNDDPFPVTINYDVAAGLIIKDPAGIEFITQKKGTIFEGSFFVVVGAKQAVHVTDNNLGLTTSAADQTFKLDADYQHGTLQITINSQTWELRSTLALSGPQDKHFIVRVNESKEAWVIFGDNTHGVIPTSGQIVYGTFYTCFGLNGNVEEDTLVVFDNKPTLPSGSDDLEVTNPIASAGGLNEEGIEGIRKMAPLSLRTMDRAVTEQDHEDIALLVPGVGKASIEFNSQLKIIDIYISPEGGGIASSQLLLDVENYFVFRKMISTVVEAHTAGETVLIIKLSVTARFRRDATEAEEDIIRALVEEFGFNNSGVNRKIRKSDIIALVDNLDKVDYLSLDKLTTIPYPRIINGVNELSSNWYVEVTSDSVEIVTWRLTVISSTEAKLYRQGPTGNEQDDGTVVIHSSDPGNTDYTSKDDSLKLGIWGTFVIQDTWVFKTYPYNEDIVFEDYTVPTINIDELDITVTEQNIQE